MAIKINNKDLYRRVINGQDVQRVILNGSQIRPTSQPHIDYHVISNRGTGGGGGSGIPGGWGAGGSIAVGESGITNGWDTGTGSQGTADLQYNGLPSLLNARKVEIIYSFYWNQTDTNSPFDSFLEYNSSATYEASISIPSPERVLWFRPFTQSGYFLRDSSAGNYVMTAVLDLENESATLTLEGPNGFSQEIEASLTSTQIFNIRHSTDFWIYLNDGVRLSRVDFFVYNNPQSQSVGAGIYHNATLGLISYSLDGENWVTIADKDLGASEIYGQGLLYQRGNNHGFPAETPSKTSSTMIDVEGYGPGNYYESDTFITGDAWYSNWYNSNGNYRNLRGGITNTELSKRGPCLEGYHIPTGAEFDTLTNIITALVGSNEAEDCHQYFLIDTFNMLDYDGHVSTSPDGYSRRCWLSSYDSQRGIPEYAHVYTTPSWVSSYGACFGLPIRPFKNTYVVPDSTRTVLYQPS